MHRLITNLIAPILPALLPLILLAACATTPGMEASQACEDAQKGDIAAATVAADKAYASVDKLNVEGLCKLAAAYATIAITTGDLEAAGRFEEVYQASIDQDSAIAEKYYASLDPQMTGGLKIVSGLLAGNKIYSHTTSTTSFNKLASVQASSAIIADEAIAED